MKKQNTPYVIITLIFAVIGIVLLLVGLALEGWNIEHWFSSRFFWLFIGAVVLYGLIFLYVWLKESVRRY